ncbi:MAG: hypothetical protein WBB37_02740 [bacterium]
MIIIIIITVIIGLFFSFAIYMSWKKRKIAGLFRQMKLSGEVFIITPEFASFRGATSTYGRVKCDGVIGLTDRKVVFMPLVGKKMEIALESMKDVTEEKNFLGSYRAGMSFLVLHDSNLDIGFFVKDNIKWQNALSGIIK